MADIDEITFSFGYYSQFGALRLFVNEGEEEIAAMIVQLPLKYEKQIAGKKFKLMEIKDDNG